MIIIKKQFFLLFLIVAILTTYGCSDCEQIKKEARSLKESYESCKEGDECIDVSLYDLVGLDNCMMAFQCLAAFRKDADLEKFKRKAKDLTNEFDSYCMECTQASCRGGIGKGSATCNISTGKCEINWEEIENPDLL